MAKFKHVVIPSGSFILKDKPGEAIPGLDLSKYIRNILAECGIECLNCLDNPCVTASKIGTIVDLQREIESLKARIVALGG